MIIYFSGADKVAKKAFKKLAAKTGITFKKSSKKATIRITNDPFMGDWSAGYCVTREDGSCDIYVRSGLEKDYHKYVTIHEIGHALGLNHSTKTNSIMQMGKIGFGVATWFNKKDIKAIKANYES